MEEASSDASPTELMGPKETYHHVFFYFVQALRILAMTRTRNATHKETTMSRLNFRGKFFLADTSSAREN